MYRDFQRIRCLMQALCWKVDNWLSTNSEVSLVSLVSLDLVNHFGEVELKKRLQIWPRSFRNEAYDRLCLHISLGDLLNFNSRWREKYTL